MFNFFKRSAGRKPEPKVCLQLESLEAREVPASLRGYNRCLWDHIQAGAYGGSAIASTIPPSMTGYSWPMVSAAGGGAGIGIVGGWGVIRCIGR